jgi:hypothetical protein
LVAPVCGGDEPVFQVGWCEHQVVVNFNSAPCAARMLKHGVQDILPGERLARARRNCDSPEAVNRAEVILK